MKKNLIFTILLFFHHLTLFLLSNFSISPTKQTQSDGVYTNKDFFFFFFSHKYGRSEIWTLIFLMKESQIFHLVTTPLANKDMVIEKIYLP